MRLFAAILALVACCQATPSWAEDDFPYTAYLAADDVYVRSGPGENYYPVLKLRKGDRVDVYRHDPGGWYAIRPPEKCFSWVSGEFIEPTEGNLGVVTGERVVARVGSAFSDIRDVIQVRLDRGEMVEVLEAKRFNSGPAAQTWYKISPPAGEFRWVSGRFVDRNLEPEPPREPSPGNNLLLARQARNAEGGDEDETGVKQDDESNDDPLTADHEPGDDNQVRLAAHTRHLANQRGRRKLDEETQPPRARESDADSDADADADDGDDADRLGDRSDKWSRLRRRLSARGNVSAEDLDLLLSATVVDEPSRWDLASVRSKADRALRHAETAVERGRVRRVLRKIDSFADIQRRELQFAGGSQGPAPALQPAAGLAHHRDARFDGVGRLTTVLTRQVGGPQFALVDNTGQVRCYVTPAPGVNLRQYLNQDVGVNGTLGYLPDLRTQHVTASHVSALDGGRWR